MLQFSKPINVAEVSTISASDATPTNATAFEMLAHGRLELPHNCESVPDAGSTYINAASQKTNQTEIAKMTASVLVRQAMLCVHRHQGTKITSLTSQSKDRETAVNSQASPVRDAADGGVFCVGSLHVCMADRRRVPFADARHDLRRNAKWQRRNVVLLLNRGSIVCFLLSHHHGSHLSLIDMDDVLEAVSIFPIN